MKSVTAGVNEVGTRKRREALIIDHQSRSDNNHYNNNRNNNNNVGALIAIKDSICEGNELNATAQRCHPPQKPSRSAINGVRRC